MGLPTVAMTIQEETTILLATGCSPKLVKQLTTFAIAYRHANSTSTSKQRRLGTAGLVRIAKRLAVHPEDSLWTLLHRGLLSEFLPLADKEGLRVLFEEAQIKEEPTYVRVPAFHSSEA